MSYFVTGGTGFIGQNLIGEVLEKKQAREVYETEKQAGRDAGLTEKNDYKTFDISVSPIRAPGDENRLFIF